MSTDNNKPKEPPLDVDQEFEARRLNPKLEGIKGFMENFSTFAAFGLLGGAMIAAVTLTALAISAGGLGAIAVGGMSAWSLGMGITFAASAIAAVVGGSHYAAKRIHHAERVNEMMDDAKYALTHQRGVTRAPRTAERSASRAESIDDRAMDEAMDEPRRERPQWLEEKLARGPRAARGSMEDYVRGRDTEEGMSSGHRYH